jgi:hypothetical protein
LDDFIDIIKYSKKYCEMDCKVLKDGYDTFRSWIKEVCDLDIVNYCSIASLSMDYLIKEGCFRDNKIFPMTHTAGNYLEDQEILSKNVLLVGERCAEIIKNGL